MGDDGIIEVVLRVRGVLTSDGGDALAENLGRVDAAVICRLNRACPPGTVVGRLEVEQALAGAETSRVETLGQKAWAAEAVRRFGDVQREDDRRPEPLDLSAIQRLFGACDLTSPAYDREFHLKLFDERPEWFGKGGLPRPRPE